MHKMEEPCVKKLSFRRLSLFKSNSIQHGKVSPVVTTNTIFKEYDPETGNKIINNFMILKEIGRGMHGKVKLAEDLDTGELIAIKIVDKQARRKQLGYTMLRAKNNASTLSDSYNESEQKIRKEIAILKKCAHPHVVTLKEVIDDPASRKIYLALEYMENGELIWRESEDSHRPVLTIDESRSIFRDVVSGLDYLHYQGIIHRDIKPANLLLTHDNVVKISDFGVSYFNQHLAGTNSQYDDQIDRDLAETAGTPAFFAPELCSSIDTTCMNLHQFTHHVTKAIDVWALGVTLYCLIYGQCPFSASTEFELFDLIPTAPLVFPSYDQVGFETPDDLKDLLLQLLTKDPQHRITLDQVKRHPWVIQDLHDPSLWWKETDPAFYQTVHVTDDDVSKAVTIMDRLRRSIRRISSSFSSFTHSFSSKSSSLSDQSTFSPLSNSSSTIKTSRPVYQEEEDNNNNDDDAAESGWIPTSFTDSEEEEEDYQSSSFHPMSDVTIGYHDHPYK